MLALNFLFRSITRISVCPLDHSVCAYLTYHLSYHFCSSDVNLNSKDSEVYISVSFTVHCFLSVFCKITPLCGKWNEYHASWLVKKTVGLRKCLSTELYFVFVFLQVTMATIGINGPDYLDACETTLFTLRMATWNQILDPWVYILLRKAVLKNLYKLTRRCCGVHIISLHVWELSSIKNSLKVAAISESPVTEKVTQQTTT